MRLGRLAVAGLTAGVVAGFVIALLPRRRRTVLDLTVHDPADETAPEPAVPAAPVVRAAPVVPAAPIVVDNP